MPSALDLSSARMGTNVNEREVKDLPINGRQLSQLYLQAPGLGQQRHRHLRRHPLQRPRRRAEHHPLRRRRGHGDHRRLARQPERRARRRPSGCSPASRTCRSSASTRATTRPNTARARAARSRVVTKSGSNQFHGSAFEYLRDDAFDSQNYFDPSRSRRSNALNQFGGSFGGPIVKDNTFFFGSYEGYRLDSGINFVEAVPSAAALRARRAGGSAAATTPSAGPARVILPGASANPDFDILQLQDDVEREGGLLQRPGRSEAERRTGRSTVATSATTATTTSPKA